jgi:integrase
LIKLLNINHPVADWEIDGYVLRMRNLVKNNEQNMLNAFSQYKETLRKRLYVNDNTSLCEAFLFFKGFSFVRIGYTVFRNDFLDMYRYYCKRFSLKWSETEESLPFSKISFKRVFEVMLENESIVINYGFKSILQKIDDKQCFSEIFEEEYFGFWTEKVKFHLLNKIDLIAVSQKIGISDTIKCCIDLSPQLTIDYIGEFAKHFTERRELITAEKLHISIFGLLTSAYSDYYKRVFSEIIQSVVTTEVKLQKVKFLAENHLQLKMESDKWIMYSKHGPSIYFKTHDFSVIHSLSIRQEVKYYVKQVLGISKEVKSGLEQRIAIAMNLITERNPYVKYFADISEADVSVLRFALENDFGVQSNKKSSVVTISGIFQCCNIVMNYLMGDQRDENIRSPKPHYNPFNKYVFRNLSQYHTNTSIIPETVIEEIEKHLSELNLTHQLYYKIFSNTGMRSSEVLFLEEDCIEKCKYDNLAQLKYKPNKIIAARRKRGIGDYHRILIPLRLADQIKKQIKVSAGLREKCNLPYIFLNEHPNDETKMFCVRSFVKAINRLIKKHNICEYDGTVWHFTNRQCRKTIAVTLIENGATIEELAYWLGHLSRATSANYYAEVRKMKLAELNTEFFRKKFDLLLSKSQLEAFSEEERKLLYIDFRLKQRRVEFGFCLKKITEEGCKSRNSIYNCINCKNLCTGKKYLSYWKDMLSDQQKVIDNLLEVYCKNNIKNYEGFKEYRQEKKLLESYQNIIGLIESDGCPHE